MTSALGEIKTAELTTATRNATINGILCMEGQIIALLDEDLVAATEDLLQSTLKVLEEAKAEKSELITLYWGADQTQQEAQEIAHMIGERFPKQEVELVYGGQPHYDLICSVE